MMPAGFEYLWRLFVEIRNGASEGMNGTRITWQDLRTFSDFRGISIDAWEAEAIMAMDDEMRSYSTTKGKT